MVSYRVKEDLFKIAEIGVGKGNNKKLGRRCWICDKNNKRKQSSIDMQYINSLLKFDFVTT